MRHTQEMKPEYKKTSWRSRGLVAAQLAGLAYLALTGPVIAARAPWLILEGLAAGLGCWAVAVVKLRHLRIVPEPGSSAPLATVGPYRCIRHPMYTAVVFGSLALVLNHPGPARWAVWTLLALVFVLKLNHEERLLLSHFPDYAEYRARTWRLVPWIY